MPTPLAPVTLTAGTAQTVNLGSQGSVGAVVIGNESPYAIMASAGSGGIWVLAQMADRLNCDTTAFNGNITLSAVNYLSNSNQAPSYQVYLTVFAPGEAIPGTYPCALSRMFNVGNSLVTNSPANVFEQDLFAPFVLSGYTAAKDGSVSNQLDVTSGIAFLRQPTDSSLLRIANSSTTFLTTTPTATYFLDLNPDGSWSWATTHSGVTNHLTIASATTDGSGNISAVSDARVTGATLLASMLGNVVIPNNLSVGGASGAFINLGTNAVGFWTPQVGGAYALQFLTWNGSALKLPFSIGTPATGSATMMSDAGAFSQLANQPTAGSFGVPVIVAQVIRQHVTTVGGNVTVLSFTPSATGLYRVNGYVVMQDTAARALGFIAQWTDPDSNFAGSQWLTGVGGVGGTTVQAFNNSNLWNNGIGFGAASTPFVAKAGAGINVVYQHDTGTANDYVTAVIERLA